MDAIMHLLLEPNPVNTEWVQALRIAFEQRVVTPAVIEVLAEDIGRRYDHDSRLMDGLSRLGFFTMATGGDLSAAERLFAADSDAGRQGWVMRLRHAECRAGLGDYETAVKWVAAVYEAQPEAKDGYARVAWRRFWGKQDYPSLLTWMIRDSDSSRMSPVWRLHYAQALAAAGRYEDAASAVRKAYADDLSLRDGYAEIGHLLRTRKDYSFAISFYKQDDAIDRLSPVFRLELAELKCRTGDWDGAIADVDRAYDESESVSNGYMRLLEFLGVEQFPRIACELIMRETRHGDDPVAVESSMRDSLRRLSAASCLLNKRVVKDRESGLDYVRQYAQLERMLIAGTKPQNPVAVFNSTLEILRAQDTLTQYREIAIEQHYYFEYAGDDPRILDGGANIGMAIAGFKYHYPSAVITAFEPHPGHFQVCRRNIDRNLWANVELLPYALGGEEEILNFNLLEQNPMGSGITNRLHEDSARRVPVKCMPLGAYLQHPVDFLKLDIEGAEAAAIASAGDLLANVRAGFIEYHYDRGSVNSLGDILNALDRQKFHYRVIEPSASLYNQIKAGADILAPKHWSLSICLKSR